MKLHLTKGLLTLLVTGFVAAGQAMAETKAVTDSQNATTYTGDAAFNVTGNKIEVGTNSNLLFTSSSTFNGSVDITGTGYDGSNGGEVKGGAISVEGDTTAAAIAGTLTLTGDAGVTVWKNAASLSVGELDLAGKTLTVNSSSYASGAVKVSDLKSGSTGTLKVAYGTLELDSSDVATGLAVVVDSNATLKSSAVLSHTGAITLNGTLDLTGVELTGSAITHSHGANGLKGSGTAYTIATGAGALTGTGKVKIDDTDTRYSLNSNGTTFTKDFAVTDSTTYYVNEGTVAHTYLGDAANVSVAGGATLQYTTNEKLGSKNVTLQGTEGSTATMTMNSGCYQVFGGTITLKGNAAITGDTGNGLIEEGGSIVVEGKKNVISSAISIRTEQEIEVKAKGELTLSGPIMANQWSTGEGKYDKLLTKTGEGTLTLADGITFSGVKHGDQTYNAPSLNVEQGALDISALSTLNAAALTLSNEATLVLGTNFGESALSFSGALTFNVDLDGISTLADETSYTTISLSGTTADAFADGTTLFSGVSSTGWTDSQVTLDFGNGSTGLYNLTLSEGKVLATAVPTTGGDAVPEPTTATLSLLALAGLCARRRRK